jgi:hypothetical protein
MNTQREQDRKDVQEVKPGDLKASDFFPPGVGWNQAGGEEEEVRIEELRRERERSTERH